MPADNRAVQILKAISMFDIEEDYNDKEARDKLAILFRELVTANDSKSKEFLERFLNGVNEIIADMGIIDKPEEEPAEDEVEMPEPEAEDVPEEPTDEPETEEKPEEPAEDEVPDELLGAGYNPLVSMANGFLDY